MEAHASKLLGAVKATYGCCQLVAHSGHGLRGVWSAVLPVLRGLAVSTGDTVIAGCC